MSIVAKNPEIIHEPGIYFGMPDDEYHADEALGSTDIKMLATKPWLWQRNRLRPASRKVTSAMIWGSALHCYVLEGKEEFEERYAVTPHPSQYEGCLNTIDDLKEFLKDRGVSYSGKRKSDLIDSVREFLGHPLIFDDVVKEFQAVKRVDPEYKISQNEMQEIRDAAWYMEQDPTLNAIMSAGSLVGGAAEVSIFYEISGVRRKCRFDFAIPPVAGREYAMLSDLKTFANFRGDNVEAAAIDTIYRMGYDLQAVGYMKGYLCGTELFKSGKVFGDEPFEGYANSLFTSQTVWWSWIMIHKDGGFHPSVYWFRTDDEAYARDLHFQQVEVVIEQAISNFHEYADEYGLDRLWPAKAKLPLRITSGEIPNWSRGY